MEKYGDDRTTRRADSELEKENHSANPSGPELKRCVGANREV